MNFYSHICILVWLILARLIEGDAADRLTRVHEFEGVVDFFQRHRVGDQVVNVDLAVHVPVHDLGNFGAPAYASESRTFPNSPRDELEWPSADLLAGCGNADDDRDTPAAMAALERLTHEVGVADAFEAVIRAAAGQIDQIRHQVSLDFLRIDEVRHAEFLGKRLALRIDVDSDDLVGADEFGALDDIQANTAQSEHHHVGAGLHLRRVGDGADPGGHAATDVAHLVEGGIFANLGNGNLRKHRKVREGGTSHVVMDHFLADGEAAGPIGHEPLALRGAYGGAEVGFLRGAGFALAAFGSVEGDHVIALLHGGHAGSDIDDDSGSFVAENRGEQALRVGARAREFIGVADSGGFDFHQHLAGARPLEIHHGYFERLAGGVTNCGFGFHKFPSVAGELT